MNVHFLLLLFFAVQWGDLVLEDEFGVQFVPPDALAYVVLDNQSCALCNKDVYDFISRELQGLPTFTLIDTKQSRSMRFMELERHESYFDLFESRVLFPAPNSAAVKSHFGCSEEKTPFIVVIADRDTLVFGHSFFDGSVFEKSDQFDRLHSLLGK